MKKNYSKFVKASNAVDAAAPARKWGKGVPGKRTARNFNFRFSEKDVLRLCFGIEPEETPKEPETKSRAVAPKGGKNHAKTCSNRKNEQKGAA